jgi:hypothetical protein
VPRRSAGHCHKSGPAGKSPIIKIDYTRPIINELTEIT